MGRTMEFTVDDGRKRVMQESPFENQRKHTKRVAVPV